MQNVKRWIQVSFVLLAGITWIFFYYLSDTLWDLFKLPSPADWFVMPPQLIGGVAAVILYVILHKNTEINQFASEVASELSKVTWPDKKETVLSAGIIIIVIAICSMIMFGFDSLWGTIVKIMYK